MLQLLTSEIPARELLWDSSEWFYSTYFTAPLAKGYRDRGQRGTAAGCRSWLMYELQVGSFPKQVPVCNRTVWWWSPSYQMSPLYLTFVLTTSIQVYSLLALGLLCHAGPRCLHRPTALYWGLRSTVWRGLWEQHLTFSRPYKWQETLVPGCTSQGRANAIVSANLAH